MENSKVQELLDKVKQGVADVKSSDNWKEYLRTSDKFWNYSFTNQWLIAVQSRFKASRVAGFHTWLELGRHVKKGEKGLAILAPVIVKVKEPKAGEEGKRTVVNFRTVYVFDILQTEGKELPELCHPLKGDDLGLFPNLEAYAIGKGLKVIKESGADIDKLAPGAMGYYLHSESLISVRADSEPLQATKTLLHELAHFTLGHGTDKDTPINVKELQAETAAFVMAGALGLDTASYSFEYLASWHGKEGTEKALVDAGTKAMKAAKTILTALSALPVEAAIAA